MKRTISIRLDTTFEQDKNLLQLQTAYHFVCNQIVPEVTANRCWNRVALHRLVYAKIRTISELGSQMVCNAIYAVSRTSRLIFQTPASPFSLAKLGNKPLPLMQFADSCPVYFDRHTLSIKVNKLSLFTLDGRMHFELTLPEEQLLLFRVAKLKEIVLTRRLDNAYELAFWLEPAELEPSQPLIPEYLSVEVSL